METEDKILYENGDFFAYRISKDKIEIRKNLTVGSKFLGNVTNKARAKRFIDRAVLYPDNF